ncbi:hypothetical protein CR158_06175 [Halomonas heilongjiangensis]|uniref:Lipoprotein n=1 Tax=Halomonas heilongjiangensis TaxID=1387883 RepID=A0A2N7THJ9_9GAMM|nr:hypothetical protein [Halomonas heilongjiangensis]PMR67656.1 hypothetical protein C1H66_18550 [Halomonas heilongjiangensis]PXX92077.1 hypothetical protein CR158_06175 [Halomonas heilongjiangensis]
MSRRLLSLPIALLSVLLVAGCSYQPARIKSEPLIVIDDDRGGYSRGGGGFCPPGQAKKGRC